MTVSVTRLRRGSVVAGTAAPVAVAAGLGGPTGVLMRASVGAAR